MTECSFCDPPVTNLDQELEVIQKIMLILDRADLGVPGRYRVMKYLTHRLGLAEFD